MPGEDSGHKETSAMCKCLIAVLVVLFVLLLLSSDFLSAVKKALGLRCNPEKMSCKGSGAEHMSSASTTESSGFTRTGVYEYNKDTMGVSDTGAGPSIEGVTGDMNHDEYMREQGLTRDVVDNHNAYVNDPNNRTFQGSNFNALSQVEQSYPVTPWGLRRRPTRVAIGVSARNVPDLDERDYAPDNQLKWAGNFSNTLPDVFSEVCSGGCTGLCKCTKDSSYQKRS